MAKGKPQAFKCSICGRTFKMAAHLARHQNTIHGAKKKKVAGKKAAKRIVGKKVQQARRPAKRARPVRQGGTTPLLQQMQAYRSDLIAQRAQVNTQIGAIERALAALGTKIGAPARKPAAGRRGAAARPGSLKTYVERVLRARGRSMAVKDVTDAVLRAGFKSTNKTLAKSVGIALSQMRNVRKVSRGLFSLK